jgi:hypothetical protein
MAVDIKFDGEWEGVHRSAPTAIDEVGGICAVFGVQRAFKTTELRGGVCALQCVLVLEEVMVRCWHVARCSLL